MQALVRPVVLRPSWYDAVLADTECDPPHRELAEATAGGSGTRGAMVGADRRRQAVRMQQALEARPRLYRLGGEPCGTAEEKPARGIGDRPGLAVQPIAGAELALAVGRPDRMGRRGLQGERPWVAMATPACARRAQAHTLAARAGSAGGGAGELGPAPREGGQELARPPVGVRPLRLQEGGGHLRCQTMGAAVWGTALLLEPHDSLFGGAAHPLVAGMAAHAETLTPLGHGVHFASVGSHTLDACSHRIGLFPRHGAPPAAPHVSRLSPMLPVSTVMRLPGLYPVAA